MVPILLAMADLPLRSTIEPTDTPSSPTMGTNGDDRSSTEVEAHAAENVTVTRKSSLSKKALQREKSEIRRASTVSAMTPRMDHSAWRMTPWVDWKEWLQMKNLLLQNNHEEARRLYTFFSLRRRSAVPIAMTATVAFITQLNSEAFAKLDVYSARSALAMTIIRLVNGLTDIQQPYGFDDRAVSVSSIAGRLKLPPILVEIRHQASHGVLSPLSTLKDATDLALDWLYQYYWQAQHNYACELGLLEMNPDTLMSTFAHVSYSDEIKHSQDNPSATTEVGITRPKLGLTRHVADGDAAGHTLRRMQVCIRNWEKRKNERASKVKHSEFDKNANTTGIWTDCLNNEEWIKIPIGIIPGQKSMPRIPTSAPSYNRHASNSELDNFSDCPSSCEDISDDDDDCALESDDAQECLEDTDENERPSKMARIFTNAQEALIAKETSRLNRLFTSQAKLA